MKLGPQLHRIGSDIVAVYLIVTDEGVTLIDAGLSGQWPELISELTSLGLSVADIRGVILTHGDSDHLGFAERLRRDHQVPIFVHAADAARARGEIKTKPTWGKVKLGGITSFFWYASRKGGLKTTYLTEVNTIEDGQVLDLPGAPRIIGLPGHSPGSIAIHSAAADAVFVGDALTTRHVLTGENGPQPAPFTDDPAQAAASLAKIAELDVTWVLPGHGTPWNQGAGEIVRRIESHRS
ncbi:glyoxylase-like metal-dependent hydrolase (beta-lactamase superfamily II) [Actinoplanes lutulentus]|uniref:Glyoxylase-like metal-dependent hydrolase (Beta-lactamase superfamily II) n=1 Tax=Actinoplanes lutulentus TaxID=1287878 RepID=A0A327Z9D5_9ACTN|nr:MBL fold metallo-hydrolase [Actinoplanes lutulentus]MBB2946798.1 glyoxylase-like metal-dependent hydrolase (beta-lactamase superfamily II) [Actinoplanes lutulentus]RAK35690.1 glyoxylase-like metal-dependent hydrolase (beta-lactamase superfamily II) [Actinoplanes lutulentus]